jgi:hypothetical protein
LSQPSHGSLSSVPPRYLRNMTPDPQGYASRGMAGSSGMRLLGHCSHGNLAFPFSTFPGLLPADPSLHRPLSKPLVSQVAPSLPFLFLYSWVYLMVTQSTASAHAGSLLVDCFYPEDGGDTFLRNVG